MSSAAYNSKDIWEVAKNLEYNEPLSVDDPRYVNTEKGRGDFTFAPLLRILGVDKNLRARALPEKQYILFCGHRGCGKSTELRRLAKELKKDDLFFVVFLDAAVDLDTNNLQYSDVLMALAKKLFEDLKKENIAIAQVFLSNLETWFDEKIMKDEKTHDFATEIKAGIKATAGVPFFADLFAEITNSIKISSTYKEELRRIIKNSFSQFAENFNALLVAVESELKRIGKGKKILFIIDGTDRLSGEDCERFFIKDTNQLLLIESIFIYCAPISLLLESNQVQQMFQHFNLPMIKISKKKDDSKNDDGYEVLKNMIYRRADPSLFDSEAVDYIIKYSGGCPRELLRILKYAFTRTETDRFDIETVKKGVLDLAIDYKRLLEPEDYQMLFDIDLSSQESSSDRIRWLLYNLFLLEYNSFWRRSHPVIRLLDGYKNLTPST